jgi:hypothetical protein
MSVQPNADNVENSDANSFLGRVLINAQIAAPLFYWASYISLSKKSTPRNR